MAISLCYIAGIALGRLCLKAPLLPGLQGGYAAAGGLVMTINRECQDLGNLFYFERRLELIEERLAESI